MNPSEREIAYQRGLFFSVFFGLTQFNNREGSSSIKELEKTGMGLCRVQSNWLVKNCKKLGLLAYNMTIPHRGGDHSVAAVKIGEKMVMVDSSNGIVFVNPAGNRLASFSDIVNYAFWSGARMKCLWAEKVFWGFPDKPDLRLNFENCNTCPSDGILERYYRVSKLVECKEYYLAELGTEKWHVFETRTDKYLRPLTKEMSPEVIRTKSQKITPWSPLNDTPAILSKSLNR